MKGISDLLDSDMENSTGFIDENSILSSGPEENSIALEQQKAGQVKKTKKRHRVTMPKPKSRITKSSEEPPARKPTKKATGAKRKALEEQINEGAPLEQKSRVREEVSGDEMKPNRKATAKAKATKPAQKDTEEDVEDQMEVVQTPLAARFSYAPARKNVPKPLGQASTTAKSKPSSKQAAIPESQPEPIEVETDNIDISEVAIKQQAKPKTRTESNMRNETTTRKRAGSGSDTERGDPNLRRRLGDVTRKFENIDLKYHNLKEVGINEANANVDRLRKQCEATTQASNELIASLKSELALQGPLAQDSRKLRKDLQQRDVETAQLRATSAELTASLATAQMEIKALQAKLAASRTASASIECASAKTPGSTLKNGGQVRTVMVGSVEAAQAAQVAKLKEDLYSDLTGLIVRSVKTAAEGDTFDCLQTGRNGTLHFKLYIDREEAKAVSFEEAEFLYTPLLDANRDREMIELMPEYLTEEITFARQNAAKFYGRVVDTLTKRRVDE